MADRGCGLGVEQCSTPAEAGKPMGEWETQEKAAGLPPERGGLKRARTRPALQGWRGPEGLFCGDELDGDGFDEGFQPGGALFHAGLFGRDVADDD